jgi:hypothetical protein
MLHLDPDTLAYFKASPFLNPVDFSTTPVPVLAKKCQQTVLQSSHIEPETEALRFYLYNHAFSLLSSRFGPDEPLGDYLPVALLYAEASGAIFKRLMYYMTLIVTRESRHLHTSVSFHKELGAKYGEEFLRFHLEIKNAGSSGAVERFYVNPPEMTFGRYVTGLTDLFNNGNFSGGYGGKAWGGIANTLRAMVVGETSPEIMVDTAWTLCHNNGPIFNKGMLFQTYSSEIKRILDVQRAGMIPQYFNEGLTHFTKKVDGFEMLRTLFPNEMSGYINWFQVEALGSMQKYPSEKALQISKYGEPVKEPESPFGKKVWVSEKDYVETMERAA